MKRSLTFLSRRKSHRELALDHLTLRAIIWLWALLALCH